MENGTRVSQATYRVELCILQIKEGMHGMHNCITHNIAAFSRAALNMCEPVTCRAAAPLHLPLSLYPLPRFPPEFGVART